MRSFIAVDIPENIKAEIIKIEESLKKSGYEFNYSKAENLHITVMFIGESSEQELNEIADKLARSIDIKEFKISIKRAGLFYDENSPRVLFFEVEDGKDELNSLNKKCYEAAEILAERNKPEKRYTPHLTIARIKDIDEKTAYNLIKKVSETAVNFEFAVNEICFYESRLGNKGAEYRKIRGIKLDR